MARRAVGTSTKACKTCDQRGAAGVCAGSAGRPGRCPGRSCGSRADRAVEGTPAWAAPEAAMGNGGEPRADCATFAARLSCRCADADQQPGELTGAILARPRTA